MNDPPRGVFQSYPGIVYVRVTQSSLPRQNSRFVRQERRPNVSGQLRAMNGVRLCLVSCSVVIVQKIDHQTMLKIIHVKAPRERGFKGLTSNSCSHRATRVVIWKMIRLESRPADHSRNVNSNSHILSLLMSTTTILFIV